MIKNSYSVIGVLKLIVFVIFTKTISRKARIIRFPIDIRGRKFIDFGERLTTGVGCRFEAFSNAKVKRLIFKSSVQVNDYVHISAMEKVEIGNNVLMASHIYISDNSHGFYKGELQSMPELAPIMRPYCTAPVTIEDNVWIGEGVVIMPGVTIGKGAVIGANSVVTKSIPSYVIAVGMPAKPIKHYNIETGKWERIKNE